MNDNAFGIMQGRLLPKYKGRFQAHPAGYWVDEFKIAKKIGLSLIEFIFDFENFEINPLLTKEGNNKIKSLCYENEINVKTVCADYFMIDKILDSKNKNQVKSIEILLKLMANCDKLNISNIILPFVDSSSLKEKNQLSRLCSIFKELEYEFKKYSCGLSLETDLAPKDFAKFLNKINQKKFTVNYDSGNSASKGYNIYEEFEAYGELISVIHIKDRKFNGKSVPLGRGDVNFESFCKLISLYKYKGPLIFQTYRDKSGVEIFKKQFSFFKEIFYNYEK